MLFYRIYYTIYRGREWLAALYEFETTSSRLTAVLTLSLLLEVNVLSILLYVELVGLKIFPKNRFESAVMVLIILAVVAYFFFYKKKYVEIEKPLAENWKKEKGKNITITCLYILASFLFLAFAFYV